MLCYTAIEDDTDADELQDEVAAAQPEIDEKTSSLVSKGKWMPPGYKVRSFLHPKSDYTNNDFRSASATLLPFKRKISCHIMPPYPSTNTITQ